MPSQDQDNFDQSPATETDEAIIAFRHLDGYEGRLITVDLVREQKID